MLFLYIFNFLWWYHAYSFIPIIPGTKESESDDGGDDYTNDDHDDDVGSILDFNEVLSVTSDIQLTATDGNDNAVFIYIFCHDDIMFIFSHSYSDQWGKWWW